MIEVFLLLMFWHFLADFPLQGDFLAKFKAQRVHKEIWSMGNRESVLAYNGLWPWCMGAHCFIHAGGVAVITGSIWLGAAEFFLHGTTDLVKCRGKISFGQDQSIHLLHKLLWSLLI